MVKLRNELLNEVIETKDISLVQMHSQKGKNIKAKLFKRMAYGYEKKDNYIKKLLICL